MDWVSFKIKIQSQNFFFFLELMLFVEFQLVTFKTSGILWKPLC